MSDAESRWPSPRPPPVTAWQRTVSVYHGIRLRVADAVALARGPYVESPCRKLPPQPVPVELRIERMRRLFAVRFELHLGEDAALNSYACLDLLAQTFGRAGFAPPRGRVVCDVGCASFWNVRALRAFFLPETIVGVEIDGYRLLHGWHSRRDAALGYLRDLSEARYVVADYATFHEPADVITAFYPFLTPAAVLAGRLPLRLFRPGALFARIALNLRPGGVFVMVNQGLEEAAIARDYALAAGLMAVLPPTEVDPLWPRACPPAVSLWRSNAPAVV